MSDKLSICWIIYSVVKYRIACVYMYMFVCIFRVWMRLILNWESQYTYHYIFFFLSFLFHFNQSVDFGIRLERERYIHIFAFAYKECASPLYYILYTVVFTCFSRYIIVFSFISIRHNKISALTKRNVILFFHPYHIRIPLFGLLYKYPPRE